MKKYFFLLMLTGLVTAAVTAQSSKITIIKGISNRDKKRPLVLSSVVEGDKKVFATSSLDEENGFAFALQNCKEGFYYLCDTLKRDYTRIYLKQGDNLDLQLNDGNAYEVLEGSPENKTLAAWAKLAHDVERPATTLADTITYHSFFPAYQALVPAAEAFAKKVATPNAKFNRLMKNTVDFDMSRWALNFLQLPHSAHPKHEEIPAAYSKIAAVNKLATTEVLQYGEAVHYMGLYITYMQLWASVRDTTKRPSKIEYLQKSLSYIGNDTLKGIYMANNLRNYRTYEDLINTAGTMQQYFITAGAKEKYFAALKSLSTFKKGTPAFNFQYPDNEGSMVSLKSLKNKVVVLDIWATWCMPCRAEIPSLKKLEEEFHSNSNVAFVSVSVDEEKDKQKWKDFVKKEALTGVQLYAKGWSDLTKFYGISGIPRFMVFDQKGNIVSVDAPRPSTPELKKMIQATLNENASASSK